MARVLRVSILFRGGRRRDDIPYKKALFKALRSTGCPFANQTYNNYVATDITVAQLAGAMRAFWDAVDAQAGAGKKLDHFWMQTEDYDKP
jgi:hypothetical protein